MATLAINGIARTGTTVTLAAAAAGGDKFLRNAGGSYLEVNNGSGSSINVTITSQATPGPGETTANEVVAVGAGVRKKIGPFPKAFEDVDGYVNVTYSAVTTVTVGAYDLG